MQSPLRRVSPIPSRLAPRPSAPAGPQAAFQGRVQLGVAVRPLLRALFTLAGVLGVLGLAGQLSVLYLPDFFGRDLLAQLFNLNGEANLPAVYSGVLLAVAGGLLWLIARTRRQAGDPLARWWLVLAVLLGYLALDEVAQLHDRTVPMLRAILPSDGALHFTWVVLYVPLVLAVLIGSVRFLRALPAETRRGLLLAGGLYVVGALVLEVVEGLVVTRVAAPELPFVLLVTLEELLEMGGAVVLIGTLCAYLRRCAPDLRLDLRLRHQG